MQRYKAPEGVYWVKVARPREAKGLVPLAQPNVLVAGHQGTVALPGDNAVTCFKELYIIG
jgi:hypothetical protein